MNIIDKPISELTPYENNPRNNDNAVSAVANSIEAFGFKVPIVIDKDGVIVAGHTRYKAAMQLGLETVPCIIADDLTDEQIRAFRLADNKVSELADWDFDKLADEFAHIPDIDMSDFGFESITDGGFDESALNDLFTDAPEKEKKPKMIKCPHCGEMFEA
jgi:site-specific DNA-methyltransferase (adenine-specific)